MEFIKLLEMEQICDTEQYYLYIQKNVIVVLNDKTIQIGKILDISDETVVLDSGVMAEYHNIHNLFYYGKITDYGRKRQEGRIDGNIRFTKDSNVEQNILPYIYYDEYSCIVAGHLYKNPDDLSTCYAKNLVIIQKESKGNYSTLNGMNVKILKKDGSELNGRVTSVEEQNIGVFLSASKCAEKIAIEEIQGIKKMADLGDRVCITTKDGQKHCGIIKNISEVNGCLRLEDERELRFDEMHDLEYISQNIKFNKSGEGCLDGKYMFSDGCFVDEGYNFVSEEYGEVLEKVTQDQKEVDVYFKVGIAGNGLIAKNIHMGLNEKHIVDRSPRLGVVVHFDAKSAHIGSCYEECGIANIGKAVFFPQYMPMDFEYNFEYIYIVKYKPFGITQDSKKNVYQTLDTRFGIHVEEKVLRGLYKKIQIVDGKIEKVPFEKHEYMQGYIESLTGQNGIIRGNDNKNYEFLAESILNKQPIMLVNNRYEVEFFPNESAYATVARRARAITITNVKALYEDKVTVSNVSDKKEEDKAIFSIKDKKLLYQIFLEQFGVNQKYLMTQVSLVMNEHGYTKEKYGSHIDLLKEMSDFVDIYREDKTIVKVSFKRNKKYAENSGRSVILDEGERKKIYWIMFNEFGFGNSHPLSKVSLVLNQYGYSKKEIGASHIDLLMGLSEFVVLHRDDNNPMVSFLRYDKYEEDNVIINPETGQEELELETDDSSYEYGLVNLCFGSNYALIHQNYINKYFVTEEMEEEKEKPLQFVPQDAKMDFKMNTGKYSYLVKYVRGEKTINIRTGEEVDTIDYEYPVIQIRKIIKKQYSKLEIRGNKLYFTRALKETDVVTANNEEDDFEIGDTYLNLSDKENYFAVDKSGVVRVLAHEQVGTELVTSETIKEKNETIDKIYRIGVITDCDLVRQFGYINGMIPFDTAVVESKTMNILKANKGCEKGRIHVIYCCEKKQVTEILRIPTEYLNLLKWSIKKIDSCIYEKKQIIVEQNATHYLSVSSDAWISKLFGQKELVNQEVYVKTLLHPIRFERGVELVGTVVDIHAQEEVATLKYDIIKNLFLAYRNPTYFCTVMGDEEKLSSLDGKQIKVFFVMNEKETGLIASLDAEIGNKKEAKEEMEEVEEEVMESSYIEESLLAQKQLEWIGPAQMSGLPSDIHLGEDGYPQNEDAENAVKWLCGGKEFKRYLAAALIMNNANIRNVQVARGKTTITVRPRKLIADAFWFNVESIINDKNGNYGEYSYYIATLLNHSGNNANDDKMNYYLFAQDFMQRYELPQIIRLENYSLDKLFCLKCDKVGELLSHMMLVDKNSITKLKELIAQNEELEKEIKDYIWTNFKEQRDVLGEDKELGEWYDELRIYYGNERTRLLRWLNSDGRDVQDIISDFLEAAENFYFKLLCEDDRRYFEEIKECNARYLVARNENEFERKEDELNDILRRYNSLEKDIMEHPTKEAMEVLICKSNILHRLSKVVQMELDELYKNAIPHIECSANEYDVPINARSVFLVFKNTNENINQGRTLQTARNLKLKMEASTIGVQVAENPKLSNTNIKCNDMVTTEIAIDLSNLEEGTEDFALTYDLTYEYFMGHEKIQVMKEEGEITFQISSGEESVIDKDKENPYEEYINGAPIKDEKMFYGRTREMEEIWDYLVKDDHFIRERAIILYGQKKCGKTSLIKQIANRIVKEENRQLRDNTIIVEFGDIMGENGNDLDNFYANLCNNFLAQFRLEVRRNHKDVWEMMHENELEIPRISQNISMAASLFNGFFQEFMELDEGKHSVLVIMDEFTRLCSMVRESKAHYALPTFIKTFSNLGFVQIIIGHDSMMRTLGYLGVLNSTAEFAKRFELSALEEKEAKELIQKPMAETFGFDVYGTQLGKMAVDELLQMSGCSPCYLMRLCDKVFNYYVNTETKFLNLNDIRNAVNHYVDTLLSTDFDILLVEDGDEVDNIEDRDSYKYLKTVAMESRLTTGKDCKADIVCPEIGEERSMDVLGLLESRRVVRIRNGRVKIIVGLFREYILRKHI